MLTENNLKMPELRDLGTTRLDSNKNTELINKVLTADHNKPKLIKLLSSLTYPITKESLEDNLSITGVRWFGRRGEILEAGIDNGYRVKSCFVNLIKALAFINKDNLANYVKNDAKYDRSTKVFYLGKFMSPHLFDDASAFNATIHRKLIEFIHEDGHVNIESQECRRYDLRFGANPVYTIEEPTPYIVPEHFLISEEEIKSFIGYTCKGAASGNIYRIVDVDFEDQVFKLKCVADRNFYDQVPHTVLQNLPFEEGLKALLGYQTTGKYKLFQKGNPKPEIDYSQYIGGTVYSGLTRSVFKIVSIVKGKAVLSLNGTEFTAIYSKLMSLLTTGERNNYYVKYEPPKNDKSNKPKPMSLDVLDNNNLVNFGDYIECVSVQRKDLYTVGKVYEVVQKGNSNVPYLRADGDSNRLVGGCGAKFIVVPKPEAEEVPVNKEEDKPLEKSNNRIYRFTADRQDTAWGVTIVRDDLVVIAKDDAGSCVPYVTKVENLSRRNDKNVTDILAATSEDDLELVGILGDGEKMFTPTITFEHGGKCFTAGSTYPVSELMGNTTFNDIPVGSFNSTYHDISTECFPVKGDHTNPEESKFYDCFTNNSVFQLRRDGSPRSFWVISKDDLTHCPHFKELKNFGKDVHNTVKTICEYFHPGVAQNLSDLEFVYVGEITYFSDEVARVQVANTVHTTLEGIPTGRTVTVHHSTQYSEPVNLDQLKEIWQFSKGDVVRCTHSWDCIFEAGKTYTLDEYLKLKGHWAGNGSGVGFEVVTCKLGKKADQCSTAEKSKEQPPVATCENSGFSGEIQNQSFDIELTTKKEDDMSQQTQNLTILVSTAPVATQEVTTVYGYNLATLSENDLRGILRRIADDRKAVLDLDLGKKGSYVEKQIAMLDEAKKAVVAQLNELAEAE